MDEVRQDERRLAWLEANAARCQRLHPHAECHKRYRRNADELRAAIATRPTLPEQLPEDGITIGEEG